MSESDDKMTRQELEPEAIAMFAEGYAVRAIWRALGVTYGDRAPKSPNTIQNWYADNKQAWDDAAHERAEMLEGDMSVVGELGRLALLRRKINRLLVRTQSLSAQEVGELRLLVALKRDMERNLNWDPMEEWYDDFIPWLASRVPLRLAHKVGAVLTVFQSESGLPQAPHARHSVPECYGILSNWIGEERVQQEQEIRDANAARAAKGHYDPAGLADDAAGAATCQPPTPDSPAAEHADAEPGADAPTAGAGPAADAAGDAHRSGRRGGRRRDRGPGGADSRARDPAHESELVNTPPAAQSGARPRPVQRSGPDDPPAQAKP